MNHRSYALRARWVIPMSGPPIEGGVVTVNGERIASVGSEAPTGVRTIELGDVALLPGFVNAHTHLEFSDLTKPLGQQGISLCDWIPLVVAERRRQRRDSEQAVRSGIAESARFGVTTIGEIAQSGWSPAAIESLPLGVNVYLELIGLAPDRVEELRQHAKAHLERTAPPGKRWRPGISPHAPYSVNIDVVRACADLPLAMHIAESREEIELLNFASGPMQDMLTKFGAWHEGVFGNRRPLEFLQALAGERAWQSDATALIVHGNYLGDEELGWLEHAAQTLRQKLHVVYCPRTHAFFGHTKYPLAPMLQRGISVAIGTDSRGSNPDLSILAELRHIAANNPELAAEQIFRLGTVNGAAALMREKEVGQIVRGKMADLAIVELDAPRETGLSAYEQVLHSRGDVIATIAAGQVVYDQRGLIRGHDVG